MGLIKAFLVPGSCRENGKNGNSIGAGRTEVILEYD
jgi:hypothetical protein